MTGVLEGGWEFVWAAYAATWIFFGGYTVSLLVRAAAPPAPAAPSTPDEESP